MDAQPDKKGPGCLAYVIGGMSFIPLIGVLFGLVAIIWGLWAKSVKLAIVGVCGIAFTIILYTGLWYFGFQQQGGIYDDLRSQMAQSQLTKTVQAIEFYKVQNGQYPASLEVLRASLPQDAILFLHDPTVLAGEGKLYHYQLMDENSYHIRAHGRDGQLNTEDDVLPSPLNNTGLVVNAVATEQ